MQENVQVSNALGYGAPKLRNEVEQWSEAEGRNSRPPKAGAPKTFHFQFSVFNSKCCQSLQSGQSPPHSKPASVKSL